MLKFCCETFVLDSRQRRPLGFGQQGWFFTKKQRNKKQQKKKTLNFINKIKQNTSVGVASSNPCSWKMEAGGLQINSQPLPHSGTLPESREAVGERPPLM